MRIMIISMSMMTTMIIVILIMRIIIILIKRMTLNFRSWDAVKGVALDQKTDHADYVQV